MGGTNSQCSIKSDFFADGGTPISFNWKEGKDATKYNSRAAKRHG